MEFPKISQEIFNPIKINRERFLDIFGEILPEMFPEVVKDGVVDFKALLTELGEYNESNERYELDWAGKTEAKKIANTDIVGRTLKYIPEDSKNPESTENLYIEGDNLEALKLLRNSYYNRIKMIYIDPPYNTGNDFVYMDNFSATEEITAKAEGDVDEEGNRLIINQKSSGKYHSNWLSMMYPRLKLAKDLLRDDGLIFISVNDIEVSNLKAICNEIFGEHNFLAQLIWNTEGNTDNQLEIKVKHEYILLYTKEYSQKDEAVGFVIDPNTRSDSNLHKGYADNNITKNNPANPPKEITLPKGFPSDVDNLIIEKENLDEEFFQTTKKEKYISKAILKKYNISGLPVKLDDMIIKNNKLERDCKIYGGFANSDKLLSFINNDLRPIDDEGDKLYFYLNRNGCVRYRKERDKARNILSVLNNLGTTERMKSELRRIGIPFDYPKPVELIKYLLKIGCDKDDSIVLDFFSGSGTIAHAVMLLNCEDNKNRKYILVQYPEKTDRNSEAFKLDFKNICDIGRKRIHKVGEKVCEENRDKEGIKSIDIGFKVFRVGDTNIRWFSEAINSDTVSYEQLSLKDKDMLDFNPGYTDVDVVYEILLRHRDIPLTAKVEKLSEIGKRTYIFADTVVVCLEEDVTEEVIDKITSIEPLPTKIIFRDSAFGSDISLKENSMLSLEAQMKRHSGQEKRAYRVEFI